MHQVQFISSGIVAYSNNDRSMCKYWIQCNNHGPDKPIVDQDTGEVIGYTVGDCLNLFKLVTVKVKTS